MRRWTVALMALVVLVAAVFARGEIITPSDLNPGDTYHLVFVTEDGRDATSPDIADYNAFVQAQAEQNADLTGTDLGISWWAIASTDGSIARQNALVDGPVYRLDGTLVATGFADIWDGRLLAPISINQFLDDPTPRDVWTGSNSGGFASSTHLGDPVVNYGSANTISSRWMFDQTRSASDELSFYALSEKLTVPAQEVPEPSTFVVLAGLSVTGLVFMRRRRKKI